MQNVLTWCLRIVVAVLAATGAMFAWVAVDSDWSSARFVAAPIDNAGVAAAGLSLFLSGGAVVALIASSPQRRYSAKVRLITALFAVIAIGLLAFRYAGRGT